MFTAYFDHGAKGHTRRCPSLRGPTLTRRGVERSGSSPQAHNPKVAHSHRPIWLDSVVPRPERALCYQSLAEPLSG